jgi:ActR/RegA family two-component response regulator
MTSCLAKRPILVVEDELLFALDLADSFQAAGAYAITALSLSQALELLDGHDWAGAVLARLMSRTSAAISQRIHQQGESRRKMTATGIVQVVASKRRAPIGEHAD